MRKYLTIKNSNIVLRVISPLKRLALTRLQQQCCITDVAQGSSLSVSTHTSLLLPVQWCFGSSWLVPGRSLLLTPPSGRYPPGAPTPSAWDPPPAGGSLVPSRPRPLGAAGTRAHSRLSSSAAEQDAAGRKRPELFHQVLSSR